jgi:23S rRNA (guanosine2251-2'-O)-methyltransferase
MSARPPKRGRLSPGRGASQPSRGRSDQGQSKGSAPPRGRSDQGQRGSSQVFQGKRPRERESLGGEQIEGRQAVLELLTAKRREVREVMIADGTEPSLEIDKISHLATRSGARFTVVSSRRLDASARTRSHQGVIAIAAPLQPVSLDDLSMNSESTPFLLVLDGVTDPQNLGAVLRIAECAGVTGVVMAKHNAVHVTPTVAKVAAGAIEYLPMSVVGGIPTAIARLTDMDIMSVGLDAKATKSIYKIENSQFLVGSGIALVLGDEGRGLASLTKKRCTALVSIPQRGSIGSLNVAAAAAVACFEVSRRFGVFQAKHMAED